MIARPKIVALVFLLLGLPQGLSWLAGSALAHHAFDAEFDRNMPLTLQGVVTRIEWTNPHAWVHLDVKALDGTTTGWRIQTAPPSVLASLDWRKDSLAPGTFVVVEGFRAKGGEPLLHGHDVTAVDGRRLCANVPCRCCRPFEPAGRSSTSR